VSRDAETRRLQNWLDAQSGFLYVARAACKISSPDRSGSEARCRSSVRNRRKSVRERLKVIGRRDSDRRPIIVNWEVAMSRVIQTCVLFLALASSVRAQEPPRADGWVVLPIDEYRSLRSRAFPATPDPAPPPVDATLSRVDYDLRASGDTAVGQARLTVDVLKQGWVSVQVPPGILVRDARLDGRQTTIASGNPPRVLMSRTGRATLTLDIVVPVASAAGAESMTLPSSSSALSAVVLTIPRTGVDISVAGGLIAEERDTMGGRQWAVYGSPGRAMTFSWKRKTDDTRAAMPLRFGAQVMQLVAVGEDTSQVTASVHVDVRQGLARQITLILPDGVAVNQVTGATVSDWTLDSCALTVTFLEPVATEAAFVVAAETRTPREGTIAVPLVRVPSAERETGGVAVDVVGPGEIGERRPHGLEPADASDLGEVVAGRESPSMVAFRYKPLGGTSPRDLTVTVSRYTPQAILVANVEEARYDTLVGEDGRVLVRARYTVRNNQRSFLAVMLPPESTLWSAALAGRAVRPGISTDGDLLLPLQKGRTGEEAPLFVVELVYLQKTDRWGQKGASQLTLPGVDLPVSRTGLTLHYSPRFQIEAKPGVFRLADDPGPWSLALKTAAVVSTPVPPAPATPALEAAGQGAKSAREDDSKMLQVLVDKFEKEAGRTRLGAMPIEVTFPDFGPSIFLAAELTAERQPPSLEIAYHRGGDR
jgi:hypothetical protein